MAIELVTIYSPLVDEKFSAESKKSLVTNQNYSWNGANAVKIYKISTAEMTNYTRNDGTSRFGSPKDLDATTQECRLKNDRSFTFVIDKLDTNETGDALSAGTALERQLREVVIPEVDTYTYKVMTEGAGFKPEALELTAENIYEQIIIASELMDDALVPENDRALIVTPAVYRLMKQCKEIVMETDIAQEMRIKGVIAMIDGTIVIKVPASRLPEGFGFMMAHPCATVAPTKLEDFRSHTDPPGISGDLVEGRICYDAFVLDNKAEGIYYQAQPVTETE